MTQLVHPLAFLATVGATASTYAAVAVAIVVVYRSNRVLMFHAGELGMVCAYLAATVALGVDGMPAWALPLGLLAALSFAAVAGIGTHLLIDRAAGRLGHFVGTVLTIAVGIVLLGVASMIWSGEVIRLPLMSGSWQVGGATLTVNSIAAIALNGVAIALVLVLIHRSRLGIDMRAVADNETLAMLRGVKVKRVLAAAWLIASALSAVAGITTAALSTVSMEAAVVGISGIVAAILGGMTSLVGAILGAILIALGQAVVVLFFEPRYSQVVPVLALLVVLMFRPFGLIGRAETITRV